MPLKKYAALPSARMQMYYAMSRCNDVAILDYSTDGHSVYNFGHLPYISAVRQGNDNAFCARISEVEIALGDHSKLHCAVKEIKEAGYENVFLMPSSLASVLGFDLASLSQELSALFSVNVFTCGAKLNDDFYAGLQSLTLQLAKNCRYAENRTGFNLLGGISEGDAANHRYLARLIESATGQSLVFDNLAADKLSQWSCLSRAKLNVVTSKYAQKAAEFLFKEFGVPYICVHVLGKKSQDEKLTEIARALNGDFVRRDDAVYDNVCAQFVNVLNCAKPDFVCYADTDLLSSLRAFFEEIGYSAEYICSHAGGDFAYMEINEFIEKYRDRFVLSYDRVCRFAVRSLPLIGAGLDYRMLVPLPDASCGQEGAYRLMKSIAEKLFSDM